MYMNIFFYDKILNLKNENTYVLFIKFIIFTSYHPYVATYGSFLWEYEV